MEQAAAQIQDSSDFPLPLLFAICVQYFVFMRIRAHSIFENVVSGVSPCLTGIAERYKR